MPERSLGAYTALTERQIGTTNKHGYHAACDLIARIGDLRARLGQTGEHTAYLGDLLRRYAAKRSFVALLRAAISKPKAAVIHSSRAR